MLKDYHCASLSPVICHSVCTVPVHTYLNPMTLADWLTGTPMKTLILVGLAHNPSLQLTLILVRHVVNITQHHQAPC